ncbi:MAG: hypothetical protein HUJ63_07930, partial [Enterococcus sp.]|nr:hypothetical protein [Enterococcus sp.]
VALDDILVYFGKTPVEVPSDVEDLNEKIEYVCQPHGIMHRHVKLDKGWYKNAVGAMFGKLKDGEPIALIPDSLGGYCYVDHNTGNKVRITRKTASLLENEAICFYRPLPLKSLGIKDLAQYVIKCVSPITIVFIVLSMLAVTLVGLISPMITKILFSTVIDEKSIRLLLALAVLSISVSISAMLFGTIRSLLMDRINTEIDVSVEAATMSRVVSLPAIFFKNYNSGELTSRVSSVKGLCSSMISSVLSTGITSLFSLVYVGQVFQFAKSLVVPSLIMTAITIAFTIVTSLANIRISQQRMEASAKEKGLNYALISGVQKIKLSGSEKRAFTRWMKQYTEVARLTYSPPIFILLNGTLS